MCGRQCCPVVVITETFGVIPEMLLASPLCVFLCVCVCNVLFLLEKCWQQLYGKSQNPTNPAVSYELVWSCRVQLDGILSERAALLFQGEIK